MGVSETEQRDVELVIDTIWRRADRIRKRETKRALTELDATAEFTETQRETVDELSHAVTEAVVSVPLSTLRAADDCDDPETVAAVMDVFGPHDRSS